jgi:hypothetical protein
MVCTGNDASLKLMAFQRAFLKWLGPVLNWIQADHMALARQGDLDRAAKTIAVLEDAITEMSKG